MSRNGTNGRVAFGVQGLDAMIHGGVLPGDSTLVAGNPGTGKTTLGLHFLAAGIRASEPGLFVTFEYLPQQLCRDAEARGWPLRQWDEEGRVRLLCTTPELLLDDAGQGWSLLDEAIRETGATRLVLDSLVHFEFMGRDPARLRADLAGLMNHLRMLGVTTLVTHEIPQIVGPTVTISGWGLEFLVDNVFLLRYLELEGEMLKAIAVLKFRGGDHDRRFGLVRQTPRGIVVEPRFQGVENISSGVARRALHERARDLI